MVAEIINAFKDINGKVESEVLFRKLLYLECKNNYKLLDIALNRKNITLRFKREIISELKTDAARSLYTLCNDALITKKLSS